MIHILVDRWVRSNSALFSLINVGYGFIEIFSEFVWPIIVHHCPNIVFLFVIFECKVAVFLVRNIFLVFAVAVFLAVVDHCFWWWCSIYFFLILAIGHFNFRFRKQQTIFGFEKKSLKCSYQFENGYVVVCLFSIYFLCNGFVIT